ncbi:unnamed protein product [Amoebophrya sp. A25]|nr:unnamed protein product [Amoebophrya sp. A25]
MLLNNSFRRTYKTLDLHQRRTPAETPSSSDVYLLLTIIFMFPT